MSHSLEGSFLELERKIKREFGESASKRFSVEVRNAWSNYDAGKADVPMTAYYATLHSIASKYLKENNMKPRTQNKLRKSSEVKLRQLIERLIKEESEKTEFGVRWSEFDKNDRIVKKEKVLPSQSALDSFVKKLKEKDNFNKIESWL